jgi:hypothetical protein
MSNKTAIQELIEYFEQQLRLQRSSEFKYTTEEALVDAIQVCKNAQKTKEKGQIKNAFNQGYRDGEIDSQSMANDKDVSAFENAENYYNNKFNNK